MQTFLPDQDFAKSAVYLDARRLGKQRVEAYQILKILLGLSKKKGWQNHPAVKMWKGHELALGLYMSVIIEEWKSRGFKCVRPSMVFPPYSIKNKQVSLNKDSYIKHNWEGIIDFPKWLGDEKFHASHRANLLRKDPLFYGRYGWTESADLPYVWPTP